MLIIQLLGLVRHAAPILKSYLGIGSTAAHAQDDHGDDKDDQ